MATDQNKFPQFAKRIDLTPSTPYEDVIRSQRIQACEVGYAAIMGGEALSSANEAPLRWLTTSMLRLPSTWTYMVGMCLWKPDSTGVPGWRKSDNPFGYLRVAARRTAMQWNPELVFGYNAEKVLRPLERAVSTLNLGVPEEADYPEDALGYYAWQGGAATRRNGRRCRQQQDDQWNDPPDDLEFYIIRELVFDPPREGLCYDWDTIGVRAGFSSEEIDLLKARFKNYTRTTAGRFLKWDEHRVQSVWRRVNRRLGDRRMLDRLESVLIGKITEAPKINF